MDKKKKIFLAALAVVVAAAGVITGVLAYQNHQRKLLYEATYIVIDGTEYERAAASLDLSGKQLEEFDKLKELTGLGALDLRDSGISLEQYEALKAALPQCQIRWSVPFQEGYYDSQSRKLTVTDLTGDDLSRLAYFPELESILATGCRNYDLLLQLQEEYPDLRVTYQVELSGKAHDNNATALTIQDPDVAELTEKLPYLPNVTSVKLTGTLPEKEALLELKEALPQITFDYDLEVFGVATNSLAEYLNLSNQKFETIEDVEAILPYFYDLTKVDMVNCGFSNTEMDDLNKRHPGTQFVWTVSVSGLILRTDARYFMPVQSKLKKLGDCSNLRYCTSLEALDFGHYGISNLDFVQYLPNLKYLLICDGRISDATALGQCTSLEFLEAFSTLITDYWPLTNLTNLKDLSLGGTPCYIKDNNEREYGTFGDYTPLLQMTWLDRLWIPYTHLNKQTRAIIQEALPDTTILFQHYSMTGGGFRFTPSYYTHRDIMGMYYGAN